jgi:hypothetical protein
LFASTWLGLAMQPCVAMDHSGDSGDGGHAGHDMPGGHGGHDCPHCPPATEADDGCAGATGLACDGVPALPSKDAKSVKADSAVLIGYLATHDPFLLFSSASPGSPDAAQWRPPTSTIQQRFCTYLK